MYGTTAKFKSANIFISAARDQTAKFKDRQYFRLYGNKFIPGEAGLATYIPEIDCPFPYPTILLHCSSPHSSPVNKDTPVEINEHINNEPHTRQNDVFIEGNTQFSSASHLHLRPSFHNTSNCKWSMHPFHKFLSRMIIQARVILRSNFDNNFLFMLKTRPNVFVNNAACVYTYYTDINMANLNALT